VKTAKQRLWQHLDQIKKETHCNPYLANKIKLLGADNIEIVTLSTTNEKHREAKEYALIKKYQKDGMALTNLKREATPLNLSYQMQDGIKWPEKPETFMVDVLLFIDYPANGYVKHVLVEIMLRWALFDLRRSFLDKENQYKAFMRHYLGRAYMTQMIQSIRKSLRYQDIKRATWIY